MADVSGLGEPPVVLNNTLYTSTHEGTIMEVM